MAEKGDPFEVHPAVKQAIQQSTVGMEQYFEFLKKKARFISHRRYGARRKAQAIYRPESHVVSGISKKP
jgi:hypothetical protein